MTRTRHEVIAEAAALTYEPNRLRHDLDTLRADTDRARAAGLNTAHPSAADVDTLRAIFLDLARRTFDLELEACRAIDAREERLPGLAEELKRLPRRSDSNVFERLENSLVYRFGPPTTTANTGSETRATTWRMRSDQGIVFCLRLVDDGRGINVSASAPFDGPSGRHTPIMLIEPSAAFITGAFALNNGCVPVIVRDAQECLHPVPTLRVALVSAEVAVAAVSMLADTSVASLLGSQSTTDPARLDAQVRAIWRELLALLAARPVPCPETMSLVPLERIILVRAGGKNRKLVVALTATCDFGERGARYDYDPERPEPVVQMHGWNATFDCLVTKTWSETSFDATAVLAEAARPRLHTTTPTTPRTQENPDDPT